MTLIMPRMQINRVLAAIPPDRWRERLVLQLVLDAGLMPKTVLALTVADVQICGLRAHLTTTIGRQRRVFQVTDRAMVLALKALVAHQTVTPFLFAQPDDPQRPLDYPTLLTRWTHYCRRAGINPTVFQCAVMLHRLAQRSPQRLHPQGSQRQGATV